VPQTSPVAIILTPKRFTRVSISSLFDIWKLPEFQKYREMLATAAVVGGGAALASAAYYYYLGKEDKKIFGRPLRKVCKKTESGLPIVVTDVIAALRADGLRDMGIFRQSGSKRTVSILKELYDKGEKVCLDEVDSYTRADLLKQYLRELPEPVFPYSLFGKIVLIEKQYGEDEDMEAWFSSMYTIIGQLPQPNFALLKFLCNFLDEVAQYENINAMSKRNLAIVFAPSLLRPTEFISQLELLEMTPVTINAVSKCIDFHKQLFALHPNKDISENGKNNKEAMETLMNINASNASGKTYEQDDSEQLSIIPSGSTLSTTLIEDYTEEYNSQEKVKENEKESNEEENKTEDNQT
jgi:hypothetical protein